MLLQCVELLILTTPVSNYFTLPNFTVISAFVHPPSFHFSVVSLSLLMRSEQGSGKRHVIRAQTHLCGCVGACMREQREDKSP